MNVAGTAQITGTVLDNPGPDWGANDASFWLAHSEPD